VADSAQDALIQHLRDQGALNGEIVRLAPPLAAGAAALATPTATALLYSNGRDHKRRCRVEPPKAKQRVAEQTHQNGKSKVGAKKVLRPFAARGY